MGSFFGKSPSGSTTTTQTNGPWAGQQGYLQDLYQRAQNIGNQNLRFPNFQTYADPTAQQHQAVTNATNLAENNPVTQAATSGITPYLNGSMLSASNPYFQNAVNTAAQSIMPSVDSHFAANGRYGSGADANAFASAMANTAGQMAYQNYNDQSQNQLRAELIAPQTQGMQYNDIGQLMNAGAVQQQFNQLPITQRVNQYQFNQDAPFIQAQRYQQLLGNVIGGNGTTTTPYYTNGAAGLLGAGSMLFGGSGMNGTGPSLATQIGNGVSSAANWILK